MEHVYKNIEVTGSSQESFQKAIENAIERTAATVHKMRWFEVIDTRGHISDGKVAHWQVTLKIGFALDEE
jgi:dodecin